MMRKFAEYFRERYHLLASLLMFLSFPSFDHPLLKGFPFFAWISLVPLFLAVRERTRGDVYRIAFITGIFGNLLTYNWIGNFGIEFPGGPVIILLFLVPSLSVFFAMKVFIAEELSRRFEHLRIFIFASVWILVDWIQSIGFLAFPWPFWGYSQFPFTAFIQAASVVGVMGITFILILSNAVIADLIRAWVKSRVSLKRIHLLREFRILAGFAAFVAVVIILGAVNLMLRGAPTHRDIKVSVVQSCINPWENWQMNKHRYLDRLIELTQKSLIEDPDLVIWSESAALETIAYDYNRSELNRFESDLLDFVRAAGKPFLIGEVGVVEVESGYYMLRHPQNNALLIDPYGVPVLTYAKIHLVPFGEWFPYERVFPFIKALVTAFGGSSFIPGNEPVLFSINGYRFGSLICYEGIFHRLCRRYRNMGAQFFVNLTNDGWTRAYSGHMQHFAASVFRAVENGIWYVRAGNTGYTALIDPCGRIVRSIPIWEQAYLIGDIDFSLNRLTVYSATGDMVLYLSMALIAALAAIHLHTARRKG